MQADNGQSNQKQTESFIRMMASSYNRIYAFILAMVGNFSDADDLMQEVSAVMWRKFEQFEPETNFYAWGMTIANFEILRFRKQYARSRLQFNSELYEKTLEKAFLADDKFDIRLELLQDCRKKLNEKDQRLLQLRYEQENSPDNIARAVQRSRRSFFRDISRVHNILHRCVNRKLEDMGYKPLAGQPEAPDAGQQLFRLSLWIAEMLDGSIEQADFGLLQEHLLHNPALLAYYVEHIAVCANLKKYANIVTVFDRCICDNVFYEVVQADILARELQRSRVQQPPEPVSYQRGQLSVGAICRVLGAIAAMIIFAFILTAIQQLGSKILYRQPVSPIVAKLDSHIDAVWAGQQVYGAGDSLQAGQLELLSGLASIKFNDGAEVLVEGPAEIKLLSNSEMFLGSGKLVAWVPGSAIGFTVRTNNSRIIDLGTEFGVATDSEGHTIVNVFEGEVALAPRNYDNIDDGRHRKLQAGQGLKVSGNFQLSEVPVRELDFVRLQEFDWRIKAEAGSAYHRWLAYSMAIRRDPDLVVYYSFEQQSQEQNLLLNVAGGIGGRMNGVLAAGQARPQWQVGRWPEKAALAFQRAQRQYVTVAADSDFCLADDISIAVWVKCQGPDRFGHIVSNRKDGNVNYQFTVFGEMAQLQEQNRLQFIRYDKLFDSKIISQNRFEASDEWMFFCVSHNNNEVRFYVDGELFGIAEYSFAGPMVLADMIIGSASIAGLDYGHQMFNGVIDELLIFNKVLSDEDIKAMYEVSRP